jgi:hypothetical protein
LAEAPAPVVVSVLWPKAEPVASIVAMAMIVVVRMSDAPAMRRSGADIESKKAGSIEPVNRVRPDPQMVSANISHRELRSD